MRRLKFIMLGGFLGAGKTTAVARLARHYADRGLSVGVVTNDQADGLVDTSNLAGRGLAVREVPGACFCCKFDDLVAKVGELDAAARPDVILAEPVGSCTDLVATVVRPLQTLYGDRFGVAPYAVLFKPSHGTRILKGGAGAGFSPKAAYVFRKQLEEADAIVMNRLDELTPVEIEDLEELLANNFPGTPVLRLSALTGEGFDALTGYLDQDGAFGRKALDIDYDTYAEGEAELGWVNLSAKLTAPEPFALDEILRELVNEVGGAVERHKGEVAHLKAIGLTGSGFGVANLVSSFTNVELSAPSNVTTTEADLVVNARVAMDPADLEAAVRAALADVAAELKGAVTFGAAQSLRPGRPTPTHRLAATQ